MADQKLLINKFVKGVNTDLAEDVIDNTFLSGGHNIKLTNDDNQQSVIHKQESYIKELDGYGDNLKPLAAKSYDDVIYIVSYNMATDEIEYGTYPSADLTTLPVPDIADPTTYVRNKVFKYAPLPNYRLEPKALVVPSVIENIDGSGDTLQVTINTVPAGGNWTITSTSNCTPSDMSGAHGDIIDVVVAANPTPFIRNLSFSVKNSIGTVESQFNGVQDIGAASYGAMSPNRFVAEGIGDTLSVSISYTPGTDSTGWKIVFIPVTLEVDCASFSDDTGTGPTTIVVTSTVGDSEGTYQLQEQFDDTVLDTFTVEVSGF